MNLFQELKSGSEQNEARMHFVDRDTIAKVHDACPNLWWRLIVGLARYGVGLARYGGVRTQCETLRLQSGEVDWQQQRFRTSQENK